MKVSIITIVYNNELCIQSCIDSVSSQTYKNIEYILIDGGSTDTTNSIIKNNLEKIDCYVSEPDEGLYNALNKAIKLATGDVVGLLHSDDLFFDKDVVNLYVKTFRNKKVDVVYADGLYVERDNINNVKRVYKGEDFLGSSLNLGWIPLHTTIFVKNKLFETHGLYDESYSIAGDYDISLRWFTDEKIKKTYIDKATVLMRLGGKSTTVNLQKKKSKEDIEIIRKHKLLGLFTLFCKIGRKIPQYFKPNLKKYRL